MMSSCVATLYKLFELINQDFTPKEENMHARMPFNWKSVFSIGSFSNQKKMSLQIWKLKGFRNSPVS